MGYNTTIVVINDALSEIENDLEFGKKLAQAIREIGHGYKERIDVASGNHVNAAHVVESHHADSSVVVTVGGNLGLVRASAHGWTNTPETQIKLLKEWASTLGFEVVQKDKDGQHTRDDLEQHKSVKKEKPKKTTAEIVTRIISQQMGLSKLTVKPESRIVADLGADSLDMVELVLAFENQFNFEIQNDDAEKCITVSDCVQLVDRLLTTPK